MRKPHFGILFGTLNGCWELTRVIEGKDATLRGKASFVPDGSDALAYRETGNLILSDGRILEAYRNYRYRFSDGSIEIDFSDGPDMGRLFVRLAFRYSSPTQLDAFDVHRCGNDIYRVLYRLKLPSIFETEITVAGPNKAYRSISRYDKVS